MAKYHITAKGEPGICRASFNCPLGNESDHYSTREAAQKAFEQKMTESLLPEGASKGKLGLRDLNKLSRISSDKELINEAIERGSDRTLKGLATNPNVDSESLVKAHAKASDETRFALLKHKNFPIKNMTPQEFSAVYNSYEHSWERDYLTSSDELDDDKVKALLQSSPRTPQLSQAIANPNNKLSVEQRVILGEENSATLDAAMRSGKYPAERIENLPEDTVYWGTVMKTENPEYLEGYSKWAVKNKDSHDVDYLARTIARNENTPASALRRLAENDLATSDIYKNKNTDNETKKALASRDENVASLAKLEELDKQFPNGVKNEVTITQQNENPFGRNRGYSVNTVMLNPVKIKELGLTDKDVLVMMNSKQYNAGVSYDRESGIFKGATDSTD